MNRLRIVIGMISLIATGMTVSSCLLIYRSTNQTGQPVQTTAPPKTPFDYTAAAPYRDWHYIIIHHSATATGSAKIFDAYHKQKGWRGVGYDFVVNNGSRGFADGHVETTWRWAQQEIGSHCKSAGNIINKSAIGICLVGDFSKRQPSATQLQQTIRLVRQLQRRFNIPPERVAGHCHVEGTNTKCPGYHFPWKRFRSRLLASNEQEAK